MAISIDWASKVISIPQNYLTNISGTLYELDVDQFRLDLKELEDDPDGMAFPQTHNHNTTVTLSGVTYARTFEIINGYTVTFEDTGAPYRVRFTGANHNIADVTNYDRVSLIVGNSAGLVEVDTGGGGSSAAEIATAVVNRSTSGASAGSIGDGINKALKKTDFIALD